jgi:inhibitor of KinA sporulation pathway (predicted exonuclease)
MATTINEEKTIVLIDGTEIKVRPLKISLLRDFMKKIDKLTEVAEDNDKSINVLLECVQVALKQYKPELATDLKALEELLDLPTVYKIVEEASGVKLGDTALLGNI